MREPGARESGGQPSFGVTGASGARTDLRILCDDTLKKRAERRLRSGLDAFHEKTGGEAGVGADGLPPKW